MSGLSRYVSRILLALCPLLAGGVLTADGWYYGAAYVSEVPEGLELQRLGGEPYAPSDFPGYFSGMLRMSGTAREGCYLQASNGLIAAYYGSGNFSIERFEQDGLGQQGARSRMILSMAMGRLILDSRAVARSGQILIELPMGKIHLNQALVSIDITYDVRSEIYDFRMITNEGTLRFTDQNGQQYFASDRQLLSGVGTSYEPSLEIAEMTRRMVEDFDLFTAKVEAVLGPEQGGQDAFAEQMLRVPSVQNAAVEEEPPAAAPETSPAEGQHPIVIEFVPAAKELVPFRGEARPLSQREAALF